MRAIVEQNERARSTPRVDAAVHRENLLGPCNSCKSPRRIARQPSANFPTTVKDYRERAKGKIAFRDFALFLPTRNPPLCLRAAIVGADTQHEAIPDADAVSFPDYFFQAPEHLNEQIQTRE